jgi:NADH-quinone oxidoreductase subunit E
MRSAQETGMKTLSTQATSLPGTRTLERMSEDMSRLLPREIAGTVNLMAHPLAGAAAFSALGIGLASHAFGVWFGAAASAAEMSERILRTVGDGMASRVDSFGDERGPAGRRAAVASSAPVAGARSAALAADMDSAEAAPGAAVRAGPQPVDVGGEAVSAATSPSRKPAPRPAAPDDLKAIRGIGPKLEKVLNGLGVSRWAEIAAWGEADIARINAQLSFNGRIERDDWVGQAKALAESGRED